MVLLVRSRALSAQALLDACVFSQNRKKKTIFPPPTRPRFYTQRLTTQGGGLRKDEVVLEILLSKEKLPEFSRVCQAGVALGALGRTSEGHSERSIQNSNCLCDRGRRGGRGRRCRERFLLFFGKFRERERTPAEAEAPVVQLVRWCTRSSVYLFGLVLIFFFVVTSP